jgi:hypothetical protein
MDILLPFVPPVIAGILSVKAVNRFLNNKISQWSFEYQVFGFGGALVCFFGLIIAFENLAHALA